MPGIVTAVIGLGNPGDKYAGTRHNAGFWFVEELARRHGGSFRSEARFHGELAKISLDSHDLWLLKPGTFMNRSGQAVSALASYYKLPVESLLVAHDELDLPVGRLRLKRGGGHGGHNGLRDICKPLGREFARLRIGIGHPGDSSQVLNYVLGRAGKSEQDSIDAGLATAADLMPLLLNDGYEKATHRLHSTL